MASGAASVQDSHEIINLTVEANVAADNCEYDRWANTFTDDGVFDSSFNGVFRGRKELSDFMREFSGKLKGRHFTSNHVITTDGDKARQECYLIFTAGNRVMAVGHYQDELVRVGGKWKFAHRIFRHDKNPHAA